MATQLNISLSFPALPDTGLWFANAAAFNRFMSQVEGTAVLNVLAANPIYVPVPFNLALNYENFNIDGVDHVVCSKAQVDSLVAQVAALDASYQALRIAMLAAGLIQNAQ